MDKSYLIKFKDLTNAAGRETNRQEIFEKIEKYFEDFQNYYMQLLRSCYGVKQNKTVDYKEVIDDLKALNALSEQLMGKNYVDVDLNSSKDIKEKIIAINTDFYQAGIQSCQR